MHTAAHLVSASKVLPPCFFRPLSFTPVSAARPSTPSYHSLAHARSVPSVSSLRLRWYCLLPSPCLHTAVQSVLPPHCRPIRLTASLLSDPACLYAPDCLHPASTLLSASVLSRYFRPPSCSLHTTVPPLRPPLLSLSSTLPPVHHPFHATVSFLLPCLSCFHHVFLRPEHAFNITSPAHFHASITHNKLVRIT